MQIPSPRGVCPHAGKSTGLKLISYIPATNLPDPSWFNQAANPTGRAKQTLAPCANITLVDAATQGSARGWCSCSATRLVCIWSSPSTSELSQWVHEDEFRGNLIQEWKSCAWKGHGMSWQLCRSLLALQVSALFHDLKGKIYWQRVHWVIKQKIKPRCCLPAGLAQSSGLIQSFLQSFERGNWERGASNCFSVIKGAAFPSHGEGWKNLYFLGK